MCAIAGILSEKISFNSREGILKSMLSQSIRRGPDAEGIWHNSECSLGQRQLHIMQLPNDNKDVIQPFILDGRYVLTWNGSIYNYIELRQELQGVGCSFKTDTDTEVLAQGLAKMGLAFLPKINGIFAFAFWDSQEHELLLAVDRFGVKPLHYRFSADAFVFASEIKQLIAFNLAQPNFKVIVDFLLFNAENNKEQTFFEEINSLKAGEYIRYKPTKSNFDKGLWYQMNWTSSSSELSFEDNLSTFIHLSNEAVQLQQRAAVSKGIGLSGGLDSVWLLSLLKKQNAQVNAFTVGYGQDLWNEIDGAQKAFLQVCKEKDHFYKIGFNADELMEELNDLSYVQEEPFADSSVYMQYRLMKMAARNGIRVIFSGQGADELLLGYERYFLVEFFQLPYRKRIEYLLKVRQDSSFTLRKFFVYIGLFANSEIRINRIKRVHAGMYNQWISKSDHSIWQQESSSYHSLIKLHKNEVFKTHLPQLLRYEDRNAAAFGIEGRQPFLDNNLSEFILKLPLENKLNKGESKFILRKALQKNGFDQLSKQKIKIGFTASDLIWEDAKGEIFDLIEKSRILKHIYFRLPNFKNNSRLIWKLQSIARWEKMYKL